MRKLTPIKVEADSELAKQLGTQEISKAAPTSRDPINYPVFKVPVNRKVLIYVPNHIVQDKDGQDELRMDKPYIHTINYKNRWEYFRCCSGIVDENLGFDGTCPLCEASADPWKLANYQIEDKCKTQGLDPEDKENETVKNIRSAAYSARVLNDAEQYYTFPIVVFDTVNDDGKTLVMTEDGKSVVFKVMWYSIRKGAYEEKWESTLENMEDEPTHPGGMFFILDYTYTPKRGEPNVRDSARNLKVFSKTMKNSEGLRKQLDKLTEGWTPAKAQEMVIKNNLYAYDDLESVADEVLEPTRNLIALYESRGNVTPQVSGGSDGFNLEKKESSEDGSIPVEMDDTDEDLDVG